MSTKGSPYQDFGDQLEALGPALDSFKQEVQGLKFLGAVSQANQQIRQIKSNIVKEDEQRAALNDVAQNLVMQLSTTGADVNRIQQLFNTVAPAKPTPIQSLEQGLFGTPEQQEIARRELDKEREFKLKATQGSEERQLRMMDARDDKAVERENRAFLRQGITKFTTETKDIEKSVNSARNALGILKPGAPVAAMAKSILPTLFARASGEVGNLTAEERAVFEGRQDVKSLLARWAEGKLTGKLTDSDAKALRAVAELYINTGEQLKQRRAQHYLDTVGNYTGYKKRDIARKIAPKMTLDFDDEQPQAATQQPTQSIPMTGSGIPWVSK